MKPLASAAAVLACWLPGPAFAQDLPVPEDVGWYLRTRAMAGVSHADGSFSTLPPAASGSEMTSYDPQENYGVGLGIGYGWSAWGVPLRAVVDGSLNFRHDTDVSAEFPSGSANYQDNLRIWDLRLSFLADVFRFDWGRIYAGGGFGAALLETDVAIDGTQVGTENDEWVFSPSIELGLALDGIFTRVVPEVGYRFRWFGDTQSGRFPDDEKLRYEDIHIHDFMLGFTVPLDPAPAGVGDVPVGAARPWLFSPAGAFTWTGFHVGAFGGWADADLEVTELRTPSGLAYTPGDGYALGADGGLAGAEIGVDWQGNRLVLGLAGEAGWMALDGSGTDPSSPGGDTRTVFEGGWYAAATGLAGLAFDRLLLFAKGGAVYLDAEARTRDDCVASPCGAGTVNASADDDLFGWTAGGGAQFAVAEHWSVGAEYRYFHIFDVLQPADVEGPGEAFSQEVGFDALHTVRGTVSFRW